MTHRCYDELDSYHVSVQVQRQLPLSHRARFHLQFLSSNQNFCPASEETAMIEGPVQVLLCSVAEMTGATAATGAVAQMRTLPD